MRVTFEIGDLVQPASVVFDEHILGIITGITTYNSTCCSYDIQWVGKNMLEAWSPRELLLVAQGKKNNNEKDKSYQK